MSLNLHESDAKWNFKIVNSCDYHQDRQICLLTKVAFGTACQGTLVLASGSRLDLTSVLVTSQKVVRAGVAVANSGCPPPKRFGWPLTCRWRIDAM